MIDQLVTFKEAAERFGVSSITIRDLVESHGISTKKIRYNGKARGLDGDDLAILERLLRPTRQPARDVQPL